MRLITVAIHTYDRAMSVKSLLESEGIKVSLQNVNIEQPEVSSGIRLRIDEKDLPLALRVLENPDIFDNSNTPAGADFQTPHSIVVPTDFSDHSFLAARIAVSIAAEHKAEVMLLHSFINPRIDATLQLSDSLTFENAVPDDAEQLVSAANGMMAEMTRRLRDEMKTGALPVVKFHSLIVEGVPEDSIIAYSKEARPFLVVMGTRSVRAKADDMIGSVTAEVLDSSRSSVLTIPSGLEATPGKTLRNILFFGNLDQEDILAIDTLYRYFPYAHSNVTIVHIPGRNRFTDKSASKAALALSDYCSRRFNKFTFENVPVSIKGAVAELEKLQQERHFDLIVVPNRRKNVLTRMFNPGIAHRILFNADVPMLVIPV